MHFEHEIEGGNFSQAGFASSEIKKVLKQLNINIKVIKRVVVALYEAEVNIVAHAYHGKMEVDVDTDKIFMRLTDKGPGIENIEKAMEEGYSTASTEVREMGFGAGMGLSNIKKNTDELYITSKVDKGTTVEMTAYLNRE
ncbi:MAG: ATP-binding protein [Bacteroidales bacterium]|nr:ATP-binding protein [Bacteroidales bacterium]